MSRRGELHGTAGIEDDIRLEVRLFFVLLDVVPPGLRQDLPVDSANFVPGHILAMFCELHTEPVKRTLMEACDEAFHDQPCAEFHGTQT